MAGLKSYYRILALYTVLVSFLTHSFSAHAELPKVLVGDGSGSDWRPRSTETRPPSLVPRDCLDLSGEICIERHSTYNSAVFVSLLPNKAGDLTLVTNGNLQANVTEKIVKWVGHTRDLPADVPRTFDISLPNWNGEWGIQSRTKTGTLTLTQNGSEITGRYDFGGNEQGSVTGIAAGKSIGGFSAADENSEGSRESFELDLDAHPRAFTGVFDGKELRGYRKPDANNNLADPVILGTLILPGEDCDEDSDCFELVSENPALPAGVFETVTSFSEPDKSQTLGDLFSDIPIGVTQMLYGLDITEVGANLTESKFKAQVIEDTVNSTSKSYRYKRRPGVDGRNVVVPFGWRYVKRAEVWGADATRIIETGKELAEESKKQTGFNIGLNLFVFNGSLNHTRTVEKAIERMYERETTHSLFEYTSLDFALVLDFPNLRLDPTYQKRIQSLIKKHKKRKGRYRASLFKNIIDDYGTHFTHALTVGQLGRSSVELTKSQVIALNSNKVDLTAGMSAGISVPTDGGNVGGSLGYTAAQSNGQRSKMRKLLGNNFGQYVCLGALSCNGREAVGGAATPIMLDLRPLSDFLTVPFVWDTEDISTEDVMSFRRAYSKAIAEHAFSNKAAPSEPAAKFFMASDFHLNGCRSAVGADPSAQMTEYIKYGCMVDYGNFVDGSERVPLWDVISVPKEWGQTGDPDPVLIAVEDGKLRIDAKTVYLNRTLRRSTPVDPIRSIADYLSRSLKDDESTLFAKAHFCNEDFNNSPTSGTFTGPLPKVDEQEISVTLLGKNKNCVFEVDLGLSIAPLSVEDLLKTKADE